MPTALEHCRRTFVRLANGEIHITTPLHQVLVAVIAAALAIGARAAVDPWLGDRHEYLTAYLAVAAVTWLTSWRAGVLAAVLFFAAQETIFAMPRSGADGTLLHELLAAFFYWFTCALLVVGVNRAARAYRQLELRVEELDEADHRKSDFMALLAHELRNPLAVLTSGTELIKQGKLDKSRLDRAWERLERQTSRMKRLVEDLLDSARVEQGKLSLSRQTVDMGTLVAQAVADAETFTGPRQQSLELDMPQPPGTAIVDPQRVRQVVDNLLHNASKFSPDQGVITVSIRASASHVAIAVRDRGLGIPPSELHKIFGSFVQLDAATSTHRGLGLGLALCQKLVEMHGGSISAHSAGKGHGSEFLVRLPRGVQGVEPASTGPAVASNAPDAIAPLQRQLGPAPVWSQEVPSIRSERSCHRQPMELR